MSLADDQEQEQLISHSHSNSNPWISINNNNQIEPSPSPEELPQTKRVGLFSKLKSKNRQYSRLAVMNEHAPTMNHTKSEQLPQQNINTNIKTNAIGISSESQPVSPNKYNNNNNNNVDIDNDVIDIDIDIDTDNDDKIVHDPESPIMYTSKDDLDLHTRLTALSHSTSHHQPRASAVNPISIPLHKSQRQITLDTDFEIPIYKNRSNRSYSQGDQNTASPVTTPKPKKEPESFTKNIIVYMDEDDLNEEMEEKKSADTVNGGDEKIAIDLMNDNDVKPPFPKNKSIDNDGMDDNDDISKKRVSMKDVFNVNKKKESKQTTLSQITELDKKPKRKTNKTKPKGIGIGKLKKNQSVFDAFKKEKKPDLSNIKNLPISLKTHLNDDASDHAIQLILDHIRDLDEEKKDYIYEQLVKDKEFIPLICNKLLEATDAKHNEIVCIWLYDFFKENNPNARLFALQFIPCLIWCIITRPPKSISGVVAALLSLYKKECNIFEKLSYDINMNNNDNNNNMNNDLYNNNDDISDLLRQDPQKQNKDNTLQSLAQQYGVSNHHNIFPKFEMPDLDLPSIYHEPNKSTDNAMGKGYKPTAPNSIFKSTSNGRDKLININTKGLKNISDRNNKRNEKLLRDIAGIRDAVFPSLNQANLSTNLHLIYVSLQIFNHYITRVSKPSICLEQMCAVIAKLCSSGIGASQPICFPDSIISHFAWEWKWYNDDLKEKQHEKYILPSVIISQFLSSIRYSLKQPKTRNIAKFALGQVHKRGHIDMIPEIILQTTSMLHSAFMDGLTF